MADQPITTSIDNLVRYLKDHGETDSTTLAVSLGVTEGIIETWADVLEKAKIIKITYKLGKMYVSPIAGTKEGRELAQKTIALKKSTVEGELSAQESTLNKLGTRIDDLKKSVYGPEGTALMGKEAKVRATIDQINRLNAQVDASYKKLKDETDAIGQLSARLEKEMKTLEEKASAAGAVAGGTGDPQRIANDVRAKLDDLENRAAGMEKSFGATIDSNRKSFYELLDAIKKESESLKDAMGRSERETQDYESSLESYKKDSDSIKRQVARDKSKILDDIAMAGEETKRIYGVAEGQIQELKKTLADIKSQLAGFTDMSAKMSEIKNSIDEISRQKDELEKELDELSEQVKAISAMDDTQLEEKSAQMQKMEDRAAETAQKINELGKKTDIAKKGIDDLAE